ncbi:hypothetical protein A2U01_0033449, partial [Trifolium medium]|nr:hypothetical protein [Trifolium medium]
MDLHGNCEDKDEERILLEAGNEERDGEHFR